MSNLKLLELDIETAPNVTHTWGMFNQNIGINQIVAPGYTLCVAAKWVGDRKVMFFRADEDDFLQSVWELLNEADAVIHYNGTKFDMPILNKEFIAAHMPPPDPYHNIDLLKVVRRSFKFTSNKLDFVAQFLGLGNKTHHKGHELWVQCMEQEEWCDDEGNVIEWRFSNAKAWRKMKEYNIQDVKLLEKLYFRLLPWIKTHPNHALYTDETRPVCPNCGSARVHCNGTETTLTMTYRRYRCVECHTPIRGRTNVLTPEKRKAVLTQSKL